MEPRRKVFSTRTSPDGSPQRHICANTLNSDDKVQFVRRDWWYYNFGAFPEGLNQELVPLSIRQTFLSETEYVYYRRRWERAIVLGESQAFVTFLLKQEPSALSEDRKAIEREVVPKLFNILALDCELLEVFNIEDCSEDTGYSRCQ
jgi:hypothetical protein